MTSVVYVQWDSTNVCTVGPLLVCVQTKFFYVVCVYSRNSTNVCTIYTFMELRMVWTSTVLLA